jgi:hypothetical protein
MTDISKLSPPMILRELVGYRSGGFIGDETSSSSSDKSLWFQGKESQIKQAQKGLKKLGHDPGKIDGSWGPGTHSAWMSLVKASSGKEAADNLFLEGLLNRSPSLADVNKVFRMNGLK